jgi:hypothetical protein
MSKELDRELAEYDKNILLREAIDRAVLGGKMKVEAVKDCYDLYSTKCLVDGDTLQITLDGLPLDDAVAKIIEKRPLWQPSGPDPRVVAQQELEAAALAGNVTAHGRLARTMGQTAYDAWRAKHAVKPGQAAVAATDDTKTDVDPKNPFVGFRDAAGKVDPVKSVIVAARIKSDGIAAVTKLAKEAGVTLGGYPLRKAG